MYRFWMKFIPGKLNTTPDCTVRYPTLSKLRGATTTDTLQQINQNMQASIIATYTHDPKLSAITWVRIMAAVATNEECQTLTTYAQDGFQKSHQKLLLKIQQFRLIADYLYCLLGVPTKRDKILILKQLRAKILKVLHSANQSMNRMMVNARRRLFLPGLDTSI